MASPITSLNSLVSQEDQRQAGKREVLSSLLSSKRPYLTIGHLSQATGYHEAARMTSKQLRHVNPHMVLTRTLKTSRYGKVRRHTVSLPKGGELKVPCVTPVQYAPCLTPVTESRPIHVIAVDAKVDAAMISVSIRQCRMQRCWR